MDWPNLNDIVNFAKNRMIYMFGRGMIAIPITLGAFTGTWAVGLAVAATLGLQTYISYRNQKAGEERLIHLYRDEIATKEGIDPSAVTLDDLHDIAYGNAAKDISPNRVFKEALERNSEKHFLYYATTVIAAFLTFGGVSFYGAEALVSNVKDFLMSGLGLSSGLTQYLIPAGAMFASGWVMGMINKVLDWGGEEYFGFNRKTTSERIQDIKRELSRDKDVSQEQVFGVYVSADRALHRGIEEHYGKHYFRLSEEEQTDAMIHFGHYYPIAEVTSDLNNYLIQADELAFMVVGQTSGIKKLQETPPEVVERREKAREKELEKEKMKEEPLIERLKHKVYRGADAQSNQRQKEGFVSRLMSERHHTAAGRPVAELPSSYVKRLLQQEADTIITDVKR